MDHKHSLIVTQAKKIKKKSNILEKSQLTAPDIKGELLSPLQRILGTNIEGKQSPILTFRYASAVFSQLSVWPVWERIHFSLVDRELNFALPKGLQWKSLLWNTVIAYNDATLKYKKLLPCHSHKVILSSVTSLDWQDEFDRTFNSLRLFTKHFFSFSNLHQCFQCWLCWQYKTM